MHPQKAHRSKVKKKLPIGIQSIEKILSGGEYVYVDKTRFAKKLIDEGIPHYFISRPRRFGKSLFLSTLNAILSGKKELFKECAIYHSDYDWKPYPILRFDFSRIPNQNPEEFEAGLKRTFLDMAEREGIEIEAPTIQEGLQDLVVQTFRKNEAPVAVLIDEYDHAIISHLSQLDVVQANKEILKNLFTTLKSLDEHLKFTFVTGVSKFSQMSLFSGPNHLKDITMDPKYAGIVGYTQEELRRSFAPYVKAIVRERKEQGAALLKETYIWEEIRHWYDGYRFSSAKVLLYNPFSTLSYMHGKKAESYWYCSGTPSFLIDQLKKHAGSMVSLDGTSATKEQLMDISRLDVIDLPALMYQTGYFTIQEYDSLSDRYQLGLPNEEVRRAFIQSLVQNFSSVSPVQFSEKWIKVLEKHCPDSLFHHIERGFSSFPYPVFFNAKERTYQGMLLAMLYGMGFYPLAETMTNVGRIDVVLDLPRTIYIIELKLDGSAEVALKQINNKKYFKPYTCREKKIVLLRANFSSQERNISDWKGILLSEMGAPIRKILPHNKDFLNST